MEAAVPLIEAEEVSRWYCMVNQKYEKIFAAKIIIMLYIVILLCIL